MKTFFSLLLLIFYSTSFSQPSDFLALKKNHTTVRSYFAGSFITFGTVMGTYSGKITSIKKDSLFIDQYDVRQMPTHLGVYVLDTIATYHLAFNYKEIINLDNAKKGFDWSASGGTLLGGGVLLTTIGLGTWIFTKPHTKYYASPYLIGASAALAGVGYLILKKNGRGIVLGKKYSLEYINVK